jgi:hypothetical protein
MICEAQESDVTDLEYEDAATPFIRYQPPTTNTKTIITCMSDYRRGLDL